MNLCRKYRYVISLVFVIAFNILKADAQPGNPCDYQNPDIYCPVDSGVWILLIVALIYGFIRIKKFQKRTA